MKLLFLSIISCLLCGAAFAVDLNDPIGPLRSFIQTNLVGLPVIHDFQAWNFDPDIAKRRRRQYIELNGDKSKKLIERLGLGIDGFDRQRLEMQRKRDEGHLGGLNYFRP